ncbi:Translocation and assembly module TamA precursor [Sulfitobacter sp. THAF37]|uniref:autotransporter assembly complex protein TamA n=1 Tax=Sulfitobacter sp. THAF37 TaxID=2587855 RepID=UPI001267D900|nr:autotransporter assembly complex family protein [Sulfitobacter sp. THAF37]QFT59334.1 Translocation and assembly module TamA precursor [Sulfitobacter sp. THAF37]
MTQFRVISKGIFKVATGIVALVIAAGGHVASAADLRITGIEEGTDLYETLAGGSLLVEQTAEDATPSPQELVAAAQADYERLLAVLYDNGYFGPVIRISLDGVDAADIPPVNPPGQIRQAVIAIDPGPQFRFGPTRIAPVAPGTELPEEFAPGQTASLGVLKNTVSAGIDGWRDQGHAKADLASQDLTARHEQRTISADLRLAPGPRLRFGPLIVEGNQDVRTQRIIDIAGLPEGQVFSPEELRLARERLRRTGAFDAVALQEAEEIGPGDTLPITAQITEAPKRRFGFGAELSSLEGLTLSTYWMHRNLLGGAERLRLEAEVRGIGGNSGGEDYRLSARFERPATFNEDTNFYALGVIEQLDEVNFFSRQIDLETGITRIASEQRTYRLGIGLRAAETRDAFGTNRYTLLTLPLGVEFDYRDKELDAKEGYFINASVTPFVAISGADNGVRSYLDARYYKTFGEARPVTFALRGQLGSVFGPDLSVAPADYLFYSGGGGTVRGQPYQSLGVDLGGGQTVGGRSFVGVSAEARVKVTDAIGIVGFADAGYIGAEEFYDGSGQWHSGAGLGVRYDTGIGPIRLDLAVPTSGPETGENFQVYIGIGQAF